MLICIITFNQDNGVALSVLLKRGIIVDYFFQNLADLNYSSFDHVFLTGFLPSVICRQFEISKQIRKKDLFNTLQYKFAYNLPLDPSEILWWFHILSLRKSMDNYKINAASIEKNEFSKQMELLEKNNVQIDNCILSSMLIADEIFPGIQKYGVPTEENFVRYVHDVQHERYKTFVDKLGSVCPDFCKMPFYAMFVFLQTPDALESIAPGNGIIPRDIQPVRYRLLRRINLILMIFGLLFVAVVMLERGNRSYSHFEALERKNSALQTELKGLLARNLQLTAEETLLKEYRNAKVGYSKFENVLLEITQQIPSYMWVKSLRLSNDTLEITVESSKDDINFYTTLKKGKSYELKNLRKNKGRGETFDYSVSLELAEK